MQFPAVFRYSFLIGAAVACAQDPQPAAPQPASLEYTGKPMQLPLNCGDEDIRWAGLTCSEDDPCPVYLELNSVEASGSRILAAGNLHTAAVTLYSILVTSEDGGRTWREPQERIRGAALEHIQFLDGENGWVSGHIVFPLVQEPFLLVTQDGGKTWKQRPIFDESAENRLGSIQQFSFPAKDSGSLIIDRGRGSDDRYELYESPDGGQNWSIKETSTKPLHLKRPPPLPATDWRIRADGPSQSFHIEHQQTGRWTSTGAFGVKLGVCKPEPPK